MTPKYEIHFECKASIADFILLRLLLSAVHYDWHSFEVQYLHFDKALVSFYSPVNNLNVVSKVSYLTGLDLGDINITEI